jgi:hypothetical protein
MQPTRRHQAGRLQVSSYLALLRLGFTKPLQSPEALVVSYTTVSALPVRTRTKSVDFADSPSAVCSLLHFPEVAPAGISPVAHPMESGLSSSDLSVASVPLALSATLYQDLGCVQA